MPGKYDPRLPPIEICGVAKVAADGTERFGATFFGQRASGH